MIAIRKTYRATRSLNGVQKGDCGTFVASTPKQIAIYFKTKRATYGQRRYVWLPMDAVELVKTEVVV
jgi:hypothetical protein